MPKRSTIFIKDYPYHIYNRGVAKQNIFLCDRDMMKFTDNIRKFQNKFNIDILSHTLMPNHFHLILWQKNLDPINEFMRYLQVAYAMYFNKKYKRVGPIFQNRFKAKVIKDDAYILQLMKYIHRNPLAILGKNQPLSNYRWSSYPKYLGMGGNDFINIEFLVKYFPKKNSHKEIRKFTEQEFLDSEMESIRGLIYED